MTFGVAPTTMPPMDRKHVEAILQLAPDVSEADVSAADVSAKEGSYVLAEKHLASLYLGAGGQTTLISQLVRFKLHDNVLEAETRDGARHYLDYAPILGVSFRPPSDGQGRTGF